MLSNILSSKTLQRDEKRTYTVDSDSKLVATGQNRHWPNFHLLHWSTLWMDSWFHHYIITVYHTVTLEVGCDLNGAKLIRFLTFFCHGSNKSLLTEKKSKLSPKVLFYRNRPGMKLLLWRSRKPLVSKETKTKRLKQCLKQPEKQHSGNSRVQNSCSDRNVSLWEAKRF